MTYGFIGLAVLLSVWLLYTRWPKVDAPVDVNWKCTTPGCDYTDSRVVQVGDPLVRTCPKCDNKSLHRSFACPNCGTANVLNEVKGVQGTTKCSNCGTELHYGG